MDEFEKYNEKDVEVAEQEIFNGKVEGTIKFINISTAREVAEFIVHQTQAIDGLMKNNESFVRAFHKK